MLTDDDKQWVAERLEEKLTTLLTAFHEWTYPLDMRQRAHSAALHAIEAEMIALRDRVSKLEKQ